MSKLAELDDGDDGGDADGGEVLLPTVGLTPKEALFVSAFSDVESETFGRATASATVAGYSEPRNAAWKLRRRPRIVEAIVEMEKLVRVQIGKVLSDLEFTRLAALAKGDLAVAARCSELQGKHLAMFTDVLATDDSESVARWDARIAAEAQRITAILLLGPQSPSALSEAPPPDLLAALTQKPQAPQERQESEK
jgi:hypothetical protein